MIQPLTMTEAHLTHPALAEDLEHRALLLDDDLHPLHLDRETERLRAVLQGGGWGCAAPGGLTLVRPLPWDTAHFGFPCADLLRCYQLPGATDAEIAALLERTVIESRERGVALLSARLLANQHQALHELLQRGFRLLDTSVEMGARLPLPGPAARPATAGAPPSPPSASAPSPPASSSTPSSPPSSSAPRPTVLLREPRPDDLSQLEAIAATFRDNRFHRDGRLPRERATAVYTRWVAAAARGELGSLVLAEVDGQVAGFATWVPPRDALGVGIAGLVVVHPAHRGRHLVRELLHGCAARAGGRALVTSTQASNSAALRAFSRCGLHPFAVRQVLHGWLHPLEGY